MCLRRIFQLLFLCMWISVSVWDFEFCVYSFRVRPAARGPDELLVSKMRKSFSSVCVFPWTKRSGWLVGWLLFKCVVVCGRFVVCWLVCRHKCAEFWLRKIRSFAYIDMVGRECVYFFFINFFVLKEGFMKFGSVCSCSESAFAFEWNERVIRFFRLRAAPFSSIH